ncbi:hypothetical protein GCM10020331_019550 [Ectobacillus funiculus]
MSKNKMSAKDCAILAKTLNRRLSGDPKKTASVPKKSVPRRRKNTQLRWRIGTGCSLDWYMGMKVLMD